MTQKELIKVYGNPVQTTNPDGWCVPDPIWCAKNLVHADIGTSHPLLILAHEDLVDALTYVLAEGAGDTSWAEQVYSWSPRRKMRNPHKGLSMHAWGLALDIDWDENPYGKPNQTIPWNFIECMEHNGFVWGGRWRTPDPMHFGLDVSK